MEYINLAGLNNPISRLIFGTASMTSDAGDVLDAAFDCGINTFDTARVSGMLKKNQRQCR